MPSLEIRTVPRSCLNCLAVDVIPEIKVEISEFEQLSPGADTILVAIVTLLASIPANILSQWLYEKLVKEKPKKLYINEQNVPLQEPDIRRIIKEEIEQQERDAGERDTQNRQP